MKHTTLPILAAVTSALQISAFAALTPEHSGAQADGESVGLSRLQTGVSFQTTDAGLQRLFDAAEAKAASNIVQFTPTMKILVEGGGYNNAWIETQPMGGEMYACRNLEVALNNQLIFMLGQRADGRLPGMVISGKSAHHTGADKKPAEGEIWIPDVGILASYGWLQGYCFPDPAWKIYFWTGRDKGYLSKLSSALEAHDAYLWRTRDPNRDGLLQTWCVWDTGEDNSSRLFTRGAPNSWPFEQPPGTPGLPDPQNPKQFKRYWAQYQDRPPITREQVRVPFASMDLMSYSYDGRATLAKMARELGNGREEFWRKQAAEVRSRLVAKLWIPEKHACYDLDRTGSRLPELIHNNLRAMYHGIFTQPMADEFIRYHLLNPAEFWTPVPLPSIAFNEPLFRNELENSWAGQPQGLTYQRAIRALENYGHYAEVSLLGDKFINLLMRNGGKFYGQFDPTTGTPSGYAEGYGPTLLAALEYISRMYGVHPDVEQGELCWSALADPAADFTYTQKWGQRSWTLHCKTGRFRASLNGRELFSCTAGVRVVTDLEGKVREIIGIEPGPRPIDLEVGGARHAFTVSPNQVYRFDDSKPMLLRTVPFDYPHRG